MKTIRVLCAVVMIQMTIGGWAIGDKSPRAREQTGKVAGAIADRIEQAADDFREALTIPKREPNVPALYPVESYGSLDYYLFRFTDFKLRNPGVAAPDYYIGYGNKYARRFSNVTRPLLSPEGQTWVDDTTSLLQEMIEDRILASPANFAALELNGPAFRTFAFETHPDAYMEAGLAFLTIRDLLLIYLTPDVKDLLSEEGQAQAAETIDRLLQSWSEQSIDDAGFWGEKLDELVDAAIDPDVQSAGVRKFAELLVVLFLGSL